MRKIGYTALTLIALVGAGCASESSSEQISTNDNNKVMEVSPYAKKTPSAYQPKTESITWAQPAPLMAAPLSTDTSGSTVSTASLNTPAPTSKIDTTYAVDLGSGPTIGKSASTSASSSKSAAVRSTSSKSAKSLSTASGKTHVVKKGETLFSIAKSSYGDGKKWKKIADANPHVNPNHIKVGQSIVIPQ